MAVLSCMRNPGTQCQHGHDMTNRLAWFGPLRPINFSSKYSPLGPNSHHSLLPTNRCPSPPPLSLFLSRARRRSTRHPWHDRGLPAPLAVPAAAGAAFPRTSPTHRHSARRPLPPVPLGVPAAASTSRAPRHRRRRRHNLPAPAAALRPPTSSGPSCRHNATCLVPCLGRHGTARSAGTARHAVPAWHGMTKPSCQLCRARMCHAGAVPVLCGTFGHLCRETHA
jgi:hypothetical protein